jgi:hypothetical protein
MIHAATMLATLLSGPAALAQSNDKAASDSAVPRPTVNGFVQVWGTVWDQDVDPLTDPASYGDPEDDPGFKVRRARMGLEGKSKVVRYDIEFGYSAPFDAISATADTPVVEVVDASGGYRPVKGIWIEGGVMKVPIGREFIMSSSRLPFVERSLVANWMVPGRDVGLMLDGSLGDPKDLMGRLRAGVYNGNGRLSGDDNPGKLYAVRLEGKMGPGAVYRTWGQVDGFTLGVAGDFFMNDDLGTDELGYGGDLMMRVAGLAVLLQAHKSTITPDDDALVLPDVLAESPRTGAVAMVGYSVWQVEPALRFAYFDDNGNIEDNGDVAELMAGATFHGGDDALRAGLGYVSRWELGGRSFDNDSVRLWLQLAL